MKSLRTAAAASAALVFSAIASPAYAILFDISSGTYDLGTGWGAATPTPTDTLANWNLLNVDWNVNGSLAGTTFDLNAVGDMFTVLYGSGFIDEEDARICDGVTPAGNCDGANTNELDNLSITAVLGLTSPVISDEDIPGNSLAFVSQMNDSANDLTVTFNSITVNFGIGGSFMVQLLNGNTSSATNVIAFDDDNQTKSIYAKFTLLSLPQEVEIAIAEPPAAWLLLAGFGWIVLRLRGSNSRHTA